MSYSTMYYYYRLLLYDGILLRPSSFIVALKKYRKSQQEQKIWPICIYSPFSMFECILSTKGTTLYYVLEPQPTSAERWIRPYIPMVNSKLIQPNSDLFVFFFRFVQGRSGIVWMPILVSNESYVIFFFFIIELSILNASKEEELSFCRRLFVFKSLPDVNHDECL